MVYQAPAVRHSQVPLRLGPAGTDAVVESMPLRCSHFDAYRFFTEPATHRNAEELTRDSQVATEQPGCLHAAMDLLQVGVQARSPGGVGAGDGLPGTRRRCP